MIIGLGDERKPFVDLSQFLDYSGFEALFPEINAGIAIGKDYYAIEGTFFKYFSHEKTSFAPCSRSLFTSYNEYKNDETVPINSLVREWEKEKGKNLHITNKLARYLKLKYGAYEAKWAIPLTEAPWLSNISEDMVYWNNIAIKLFPKTIKWVQDNIVNNIVKEGTLKNIMLTYVENDGIPDEHQDGKHNHEQKFTMNVDNLGPPEQVLHMRNPERGFYIFDPDTKNKYFFDSWACTFNTRDWHSSMRTLYPSWSIRIDGEFTDKVKEVVKEKKWSM